MSRHSFSLQSSARRHEVDILGGSPFIYNETLWLYFSQDAECTVLFPPVSRGPEQEFCEKFKRLKENLRFKHYQLVCSGTPLGKLSYEEYTLWMKQACDDPGWFKTLARGHLRSDLLFSEQKWLFDAAIVLLPFVRRAFELLLVFKQIRKFEHRSELQMLIVIERAAKARDHVQKRRRYMPTTLLVEWKGWWYMPMTPLIEWKPSF